MPIHGQEGRGRYPLLREGNLGAVGILGILLREEAAVVESCDVVKT